MAGWLAESANPMRSFARKENIARLLHSNTKWVAAVGLPIPWAVVVLHK
jgi:hypothetical protein